MPGQSRTIKILVQIELGEETRPAPGVANLEESLRYNIRSWAERVATVGTLGPIPAVTAIVDERKEWE